MGDFLGYSCMWSVVMECVFVVDLVCAWRMGDISERVRFMDALMCALVLFASCPLLSVIWFFPGVLCESRLDLVVFCVW